MEEIKSNTDNIIDVGKPLGNEPPEHLPGNWELEDIDEHLNSDLFFEDGKFIPMRMAGNLIYHDYDPNFKDNISRGVLVMGDNREIWRYDGIRYLPDGEYFFRDKVQTILGDTCSTHKKNEVIECIKDFGSVKINRRFLDHQLHYINLEEGVYNLITRELTPHDPSMFLTTYFPVRYDPDAKINEIEQFLDDVLYPEDIPVIQEMIGYCMYRNYDYQKAFMLDGDGANGKSTLLKLITEFIGPENISSVSLQDLCYKNFARATLYKKHANIHNDLSDKALTQTGVFKMLTGGDPIHADQKFRDPFQFYNYAKLIFSCNKIPKVEDDTNAYFRRWVLISFPNKFEGADCKPDILKSLLDPTEMSGLLNYAIEGLNRLIDTGHFSNNHSTEKIRDAYLRKSNPVGAFVQDCIEMDSTGIILKDDLYRAYKRYCKTNQFPVKANNSFSRDLKQCVTNLDEQQRKKGGKREWLGITLKTDKSHKEKQSQLNGRET